MYSRAVQLHEFLFVFQSEEDMPFVERSLEKSNAVHGFMVLNEIEQWVSRERRNVNNTVKLPKFDFLAAITRLLIRFDNPLCFYLTNNQ